MKPIFRNSLLAAAIATTGLASTSWVNAASTANPQPGAYQTSDSMIQLAHARGDDHRKHRAGKGHRRAKMHRGGHGIERAIRRLDLTDQQRDELFKLRHADAPKVREARLRIRAARKSLREVSTSGQYDVARIEQLSNELGQATAAMARLRAESGIKVYQLLTPQQQQQLKEKLAKRSGKYGGKHGNKRHYRN